MKRVILSCAILVSGLTTAGHAEMPADDPFADLVPLADEELAEARGGMDLAQVQLGGYDIGLLGFGVAIDRNGEIIQNFATDLETLAVALAGTGHMVNISSGVGDYQGYGTLPNGGVFVFENDLDNAVITLSSALNIRVNELPGTTETLMTESFLAGMPRFNAFGSF